MYSYDKTIEMLDRLGKMREEKEQEFLRKLFTDETFMEWLFTPEVTPELTEQIGKLYAQLTRPKAIKGIVEMVENTGEKYFNRTQATFFYSISNLAIQSANAKIEEVKQLKADGRITRDEADEMNDKIVRYNKRIAELLQETKRIVKRDAKLLSRDSGMPRPICQMAFYSVPEVKYVDRFKIGYYLNNLLNCIYSEVEAEKLWPGNSVRWRVFFKEIFGKENVISVATFILLEGVRRIDCYKNSRDVKECWDSLTKFALRELEDAPDEIRSQMIELYIKRLDKMFANSAFDLRVNLLSTESSIFPHLADTVQKYAPKIQEILNRGKE